VLGTRLRHRFAILGAAVLFSTGGAAIKACALDGWQVAGARSLVAALTLVALVPGARRLPSPRVLAVAVSYALTLLLFVLANKLTTAAAVIFLQSTAPLYVLALAPRLLREPVRRRDLGLMGALALGLGLVLSDLQPVAAATAPAPLRGNLLAAASGVCWAATLLGLRWLEREPDGPTGPEGHRAPAGMSAVVAGNVLAFAATLPFAFPFAPSARDALVLLYLGSVQIGIAYLVLMYGFRRVPALEASLLVLLEPALNPLFAWLAHGEVPGARTLAGGALIVAATAARTLRAARSD
jgi:drug/metabolite transporter (DMT)-like permease